MKRQIFAVHGEVDAYVEHEETNIFRVPPFPVGQKLFFFFFFVKLAFSPKFQITL